MVIDMSHAELGLYHWDGTRLRCIMNCGECELSFKQKWRQLLLQVKEEKVRSALLAEIEAEGWSGAGYD